MVTFALTITSRVVTGQAVHQTHFDGEVRKSAVRCHTEAATLLCPPTLLCELAESTMGILRSPKSGTRFDPQR
jgi:hypothetical protein